jgi:hypothetical protein
VPLASLDGRGSLTLQSFVTRESRPATPDLIVKTTGAVMPLNTTPAIGLSARPGCGRRGDEHVTEVVLPVSVPRGIFRDRSGQDPLLRGCIGGADGLNSRSLRGNE